MRKPSVEPARHARRPGVACAVGRRAGHKRGREAGAEVVFLRAPPAAVGELAGRHGEEEPAGAIDEFYVADDEGLIEGQRAERLETALAHVAQIDANLCELHVEPLGQDGPSKKR